jgi:hypothetical protein
LAIRLPSLQRAYDDFYSRDPAIIAAPELPAVTATDDEIKAYKKAAEEYAAKIRAAKETGRWDEILVPGAVPTKFVMGQVDRNVWRTIADRFQLPEDNKQHIGMSLLSSLLFRLALRDIAGLDFKVVRHVDPEWGWEMAQPEIVTVLDQADPRIVGELSGGVWKRLQDIPGKS